MPPATNPSPTPTRPVFSRGHFSTVSVVIILVLGAAVATLAILAWDYRRRAKAAEAQAPLPTGQSLRERYEKVTRLNDFEKKYIEALATRSGFRKTNAWTFQELLRIAVHLNQELNERTPASFDASKTPWLLPPPLSLPGRVLEPSQLLALDLAAGAIDLPAKPALYQYTITNTSTSPALMPVLYQGVRWDSAEALLETSGLRKIKDDVDRAVAAWRFVCEHRTRGPAPTNGPEAHDFIKYLACHGYGQSEESAQALATLAQACGLRSRLRGLNSHVVCEVFAGGRWRMFDADYAVYFHAPGDPRAIFGMEELEKDRAAFSHAKALGAGGPWHVGYAAPFLSKEDNKEWPAAGRRAHDIAHVLTPGESVTFSNFNWGEYFVGSQPQKPPRFYNGYFDRPLEVAQFNADPGLTLRMEGESCVLSNPTPRPAGCYAEMAFPFPIVGGRLSELPAGVSVEIVDGQRKTLMPGGRDVPLGAGMAQLAEAPTYAFTVHLVVPAGRTVRFEHPPRLIADFQFAEMALLKLVRGANTFQVHGSPVGLKTELRWR